LGVVVGVVVGLLVVLVGFVLVVFGGGWLGGCCFRVTGFALLLGGGLLRGFGWWFRVTSVGTGCWIGCIGLGGLGGLCGWLTWLVMVGLLVVGMCGVLLGGCVGLGWCISCLGAGIRVGGYVLLRWGWLRMFLEGIYCCVGRHWILLGG